MTLLSRKNQASLCRWSLDRKRPCELFRAVPDSWWQGEGIRLRDLPTAFGALNLKAQRDKSQAMVELALSRPAPERITFRYPGAKRAEADGKPCQLAQDLIVTRSFSRLTIEF